MRWTPSLWRDCSRRRKKLLTPIVSYTTKARLKYESCAPLLHLFEQTKTFSSFRVSVVWLTLAQRVEGRAVSHLSTSLGLVRCELPPTPSGLLSQQHLYYVTAHYHVPSKVNVGDFNPETSSRTLQSPQSASVFKAPLFSPPLSTPTSVHRALQHLGASLCTKRWLM